MKKRTLKLILSALVVAMVGSVMVGCGSSKGDATKDAAKDSKPAETAQLSGSITISGSTALQPLMDQTI